MTDDEVIAFLAPSEREAWEAAQRATPGPWRSTGIWRHDGMRVYAADGDAIIAHADNAVSWHSREPQPDTRAIWEQRAHNVDHIATARTALPAALRSLAEARERAAKQEAWPGALRVLAGERRFATSYVATETGCWEWTGHRNVDGYGLVTLNKRQILAHRVSWLLYRGPVPDGLFVCHHCDNPPCVNPAHLFVGTAADNSADMVRKGRSPRPKVPRGGNNPACRLSEDDIHTARRLFGEGVSQTDIAKRLGVSQAHVSKIVNRTAWAHVVDATMPRPKP